MCTTSAKIQHVTNVVLRNGKSPKAASDTPANPRNSVKRAKKFYNTNRSHQTSHQYNLVRHTKQCSNDNRKNVRQWSSPWKHHSKTRHDNMGRWILGTHVQIPSKLPGPSEAATSLKGWADGRDCEEKSSRLAASVRGAGRDEGNGFGEQEDTKWRDELPSGGRQMERQVGVNRKMIEKGICGFLYVLNIEYVFFPREFIIFWVRSNNNV